MGLIRIGFAPETLDEDLEYLVRERIRPWLNGCLAGSGHHENCGRRDIEQDDSFLLPTRLIDVGSLESNTVRLVVPMEEFPAERQEYLALSYCWGKGNESAKTTRANLKDRRQSLDSTRLPQTIQDAIKLSRLMGVRYLWVDAVCIVQPDDGDRYLDDWEAEAAKMGSYYSNTLCLVSALAASDSREGLFLERQAQKYPTKACIVGTDHENNTMTCVLVPQPYFPGCIEREPLMKRGWCLQEAILPPRTLQWSTHGLLFECSGISMASEFEPEGVTGWRASTAGIRIFDAPPEQQLTAVWGLVVKTYTDMALTFETDRLVGIHGVASRLAAAHKTEYFAGVFGAHLAEGLLWRCIRSRERPRGPASFPTWSWASRGFRVWFPDKILSSFVRCASPMRVVRPGGNEVDCASPEGRMLRLQAPLRSIDFGPEEGDAVFNFKIGQEEFIITVSFDEPDRMPSPLGRVLILILARMEHRYVGLVIQPKGHTAYERMGLIYLAWVVETGLEGCFDAWRREVILI
ncbi:hypothetical protein ACJ41O_009214 [Fusarium nematophilum]